jgi:phosphopantetheinyl transferase
VKVSDRYSLLASFLLKSRAFHEAYPLKEQEATKVLVELPRTEHNKPFIPMSNNVGEENPSCPLSVSHQFPFVGMIGFSTTKDPQCTLLAGFDIVVFDPINPKLYKTVQEFVNVFRDSFSKEENRLLNQAASQGDRAQLHELYLRWAVKEAYTKALGVGMGFDFSSFETRLSLGCRTFLWDWVDSEMSEASGTKELPDNGVLRMIGTVIQGSLSSTREDIFIARPKREQWAFFFKPLFGTDPGTNGDDGCADDDKREPRIDQMTGCACACVGPINSQEGFDVQVRVEWTDLQGLISWHTGLARRNS